MNAKIIQQAQAYLVAWKTWLSIVETTPNDDNAALEQLTQQLVNISLYGARMAEAIINQRQPDQTQAEDEDETHE